MGGNAQKRLVRKRDLERILSQIEPHPTPKAYLEQYTTPSNVAAETLYLAAYVNDDIIDKTVIELGCGTGRLAIGAALLGAKEVVGVDLEGVSVSVAQKNAEKIGVKEKMHWITADINVINGAFDTVLQNPPFGVQRKRADRRFINKSLELGSIIYSFHKAGESNRKFIKRFIEEHGGKISTIFPLEMEIPRMFKFHTKKKKIIQVDLYRIEGKVYDRI
ncbi:MAG: 50S ribosomal protein L11 methyltransferase [Candidatus Bathyarchaeota archaeon]|nr:50S ribosomal protein L11 methyltransferase [Candidatus Bathyarchaeum sp.]